MLVQINETKGRTFEESIAAMNELTYSGYRVWFLLSSFSGTIDFTREYCECYFSKNVYYRGLQELIDKKYLIENNNLYIFYRAPEMTALKKSWSVYALIFPDESKYIGITSKAPETRWGADGKHYCGMLVYEAIEKWGWSNVEKKILHKDLTEAQARLYEQKYIKEYQTTISDKGYNIVERKESLATINKQILEGI